VETEENSVGEEDSNVVFGKKNSLVRKMSVRRSIVVMQQPVLLSPKFGK
jgi:hypothetical protein